MKPLSRAELLASLKHYQDRCTTLAQCIEEFACLGCNAWVVLPRPSSGPLVMRTDPDGVPSFWVDPFDACACSRIFDSLGDFDKLDFFRAVKEARKEVREPAYNDACNARKPA